MKFLPVLLLASALHAQRITVTVERSIPLADIVSLTPAGPQTVIVARSFTCVAETASLRIVFEPRPGLPAVVALRGNVEVDCWLVGWELGIVEVDGIPRRARIEYYRCTDGSTVRREVPL